MIPQGPRVITLDIETSPILAYAEPLTAGQLHRQKHRESIAKTQKAIYLKSRDARIAAASERYADKKLEILAQQAKYRRADPERNAEQKYRYKYGLSFDAVMAMFDACGDACQCCSRPVARPRTATKKSDLGHVDHCHTTGKVRGILCNACNMALGLLNDRPDLASAYLDKTR